MKIFPDTWLQEHNKTFFQILYAHTPRQTRVYKYDGEVYYTKNLLYAFGVIPNTLLRMIWPYVPMLRDTAPALELFR